MSEGVFPDCELHNRCRYPLHWLLCRSQHDQDYTDDDERSHPHQFCACDQIAERLDNIRRHLRR
jgi:hypothetical protein